MSSIRLGRILSAVVLSLAMAAGSQAALTPGVTFYADASLDTDADTRWEDVTGATGFDFELDISPAVTRVTGTSSLAGITAAYDFPGGGNINNEAGALLSIANTSTRRSFQEVQGDWSNNDVTLEVWFKPDDLTPTPTNGQIVFEDGGGTGLGFYVDNNELVMRKEPGSGGVSSNISGISGEFIQAVGTYDVSSGTMELFINGSSVGTATPGGNDWTGGDAAAVGTRGESNTGGLGNGQQNTESFDGQVAIFRAYHDKILTPAQVMDNFNAVSTGGVTNAASVQSGTLDYDASKDDGANATWENTGAVSGRNASLTGHTYDPAPSTGVPGITAAYDFDGTGGGSMGSLEGGGLSNGADVSFEMWFRPSDLAGDEVLFETGGGNGVGIYLGGGSNAAFSGIADSELLFSVTQNSLGSQTAFVSSDLTGLTDEFVHMVGVFDISTNTVELFINGVSVGTDVSASNISDWSGGDGAGIGLIGGSNAGGVGNNAQGFSNYEGEIAAFRVFNRLLDSDEVLARFDTMNTATNVIPEPATATLGLLALGGLGAMTRRRRA